MHTSQWTKIFIVLIAMVVFAGSACATKKYVRNRVNERVTPLEGRTAELEEGNRDLKRRAGDLETGQEALRGDIRDVDGRATAGIGQAKQLAGEAQNQAMLAQDEARLGNSRVDALDTWEELKQVVVNFKVNRSILSAEDKLELDALAEQVKQEKGYLIEIRGFTDATGNAQKNLALSEARAKAVFQYLAVQHEIPAYKMNIVGFGKEKQVTDNKTRQGRAENRRVEIKLFVNSGIRRSPATQPQPQSTQSLNNQGSQLRP